MQYKILHSDYKSLVCKLLLLNEQNSKPKCITYIVVKPKNTKYDKLKNHLKIVTWKK